MLCVRMIRDGLRIILHECIKYERTEGAIHDETEYGQVVVTYSDAWISGNGGDRWRKHFNHGPNGKYGESARFCIGAFTFYQFLFPGIILLLVLGVMPLVIGISLMRYVHWELGETLNLYPDRYWAWTFSLYTGFALIIWIMVQVYWIQDVSIIHLVYFAWGVGIQVVTLWPGVQQKYSK